jgi:hypothetical protein
MSAVKVKPWLQLSFGNDIYPGREFLEAEHVCRLLLCKHLSGHCMCTVCRATCFIAKKVPISYPSTLFPGGGTNMVDSPFPTGMSTSNLLATETHNSDPLPPGYVLLTSVQSWFSGDIAVAKWERWVNATVTRYTDYIDEWEVGRSLCCQRTCLNYGPTPIHCTAKHLAPLSCCSSDMERAGSSFRCARLCCFCH